MPLSIQNANGVHIASLNGSLDNATGSDLVTTLKNSVEKGSRIILDCTRVPSMELAGFRHLLALQRWCSMNDGQMVLAGMVPDAWAMVVENRCEDNFEISPTVEAALQSLGASTMVGLPLGAGAFAPSKPADDDIFQTIPPGAMPPMPKPGLPPEPESEVFSARNEDEKNKAAGWESDLGKTSLEAPAPTWAPPPPSQGWEAPASPPPLPATAAQQPGKAKSKGGILPVLAAAAAVAAGWFWYAGSQKAPEIIIEPTSVTVTQGREISEVRVSIMNGELDRDASKLPEGLSFDEGAEFDGGWDYYITGAPKLAGEHEVGIHAFRGELQAVPGRLVIVVAEVTKLEWVFQSNMLPLDEGRAIPATSYTKIVNGAKSLKIRWTGDAVDGLSAEEMPTAPGSWRLTGTPGRAGKFKGEFVAVKKDGKEETRPFVIDIKPGKAPKSADLAAAKPEEGKTTTVAAATPPAPTAMPEPAPVVPAPPAKEEPAAKPEEGKPATVAAATPPTPSAMPEAPAPAAKEAPPAKPEESKTAAATTPAIPAPPLPDEPPAPLVAGGAKAMTEAAETADVVLPGSAGDDAALSLVPGQENVPFDQKAVDDRMRTFLMERIEKANNHFTDADKEMLRAIVTRLKDAARVTTVSFDNGQSRLKAQQVQQIKQALSNADVAALLSNPSCQLLVVGYASNTGSQAANVRFSQQRARAVNDVLKEALGRGADLCGDYGPTDLLSVDEAGNRVVEVYAGVIEISKVEQILADAFKNDFNKRHGGR